MAIRVPGTNTYLADGAWTHNDTEDLQQSSKGGPGISNSGGSTGLTISESIETLSSSSGSSSGSKSSGSSFSSSESSIVISNTGESTVE
ncbi:MAG: hypothetical protein V3T84_10525 [Phycisphaerales bacterium]